MGFKLNKRSVRSYIINPHFQAYFVLISLVLVTVLSSFYFFAVADSFSDFERLGRESGLPPSHAYFQFISTQRNALFMTMAKGYFTVFVIAAIACYFFSHKVAGPLRRLQSAFQAMEKSGKLFEIKFRKNDFFKEVADDFNAMVESQSDLDQHSQ